MNVFTRLIAWASILAWAVATQAAQIVYDVHISGISFFTPVHQMRVDGTVTFDDVVQDVVTSSLFFTHESDAPLALPAEPSIEFGLGTLWYWQATPSELRLIDNPAGSPDGYIAWSVPTGGWTMDDYATFGASGFGGSFYYGFFGTGPDESGHLDDTMIPALVDNGDHSGKPGYRLGTAVPEPSTLALATLGILGLLIAARRKR